MKMRKVKWVWEINKKNKKQKSCDSVSEKLRRKTPETKGGLEIIN